MIDINVKFQMDGQDIAPHDLSDDQYELAEMLEHTSAQIRQHVERQLEAVRCPQHGSAPRVIVTGVYSGDTEQMELSYHVDSCCPQLLVRAVHALNH
jgi:hypothetical protein